jgi:hypothetical protein
MAIFPKLLVIAAFVAAAPAAAQDMSVSMAATADFSLQDPIDDSYDDEVVIGAVAGREAKAREQRADKAIPALPVVRDAKTPVKKDRDPA